MAIAITAEEPQPDLNRPEVTERPLSQRAMTSRLQKEAEPHGVSNADPLGCSPSVVEKTGPAP
jgi:hypothetical protein